VLCDRETADVSRFFFRQEISGICRSK